MLRIYVPVGGAGDNRQDPSVLTGGDGTGQHSVFENEQGWRTKVVEDKSQITEQKEQKGEGVTDKRTTTGQIFVTFRTVIREYSTSYLLRDRNLVSTHRERRASDLACMISLRIEGSHIATSTKKSTQQRTSRGPQENGVHCPLEAVSKQAYNTPPVLSSHSSH